ncbi:MAG: T9SS type A sorting domain-containing protein [Chitinophagales bacterium]|nr:T9SS type A sorting domain-containing protein [Chitinophagales bacterium]
MRTMFTHLRLALMIGVTTLAKISFAQVSAYTFSQFSGTYTPITGGTVLGTGTGVDDNNYLNQPIGFTFNYNGTNYTAFSVNANGFLAMGTTISSSNTSLSSGTTNNVVAALNYDLQGSASGELRYETIGTSPNQILVVQFSNWASYSATGSGSGDLFNFQIRLHETSNVVEVVYGSFTKNATSRTPQVGLRGASNADFNNRTTTTNWSATTAGGANNATLTLSSTVFPANGQTYSWTPPVACSGTPTAGVTTSSANPVCAGTNFVLSLTGSTTGATGLTYQWIYSADGTNYAAISGATNSTRTDTTTQNRYYRCIVTCTNSGLSDTSAPLYVTLNAPTQCYCAPTYSSGCGGTGADAITNVTLNTLNNSSGCAASPYYTFYNAVTVPNIQRSIQQTITISFGSDGNQYAGVWIDYNQDGDFDDAGEFVANNTVNAGANGVLNLNFTVPITAALGQTRMRVRGGNDSQLTNTPCGASSSAWGETEDYIVNVLDVPACVPASFVSVGSVTGTTAIVTWTSDAGNTSTIEYGPTGFTLGTGTLVGNASSPYTLNNLTPQTAYQVYVIDTCAGNVIAPATGPVGFTTFCSPFPYPGDTYDGAIVVNSFPFSDSVNTSSSCFTDASTLRTGKDVFYKVVADSCASSITFSLCGSGFDTYLFIRDSSNTATLFSNDDFCGLQSQITFTPTPGTTYIAVVEPYSGTGVGSVIVNVTQTTGTPQVSTSFISPTCDGIADGSAEVTVTAFGAQPVTYSWNNGGNTSTITNILSGTYTVTVSTGCGTAVGTAAVPAAFNVSLNSVTHVLCNGANTGAIDIDVNNGTQPYVFDWSNNASTEDISGLTAGTYSLTATEDGGCSTTFSITITEPTAIDIPGTATMPSCNAGSNGAIDITPSGGFLPNPNGSLTTLFSGGNGCTNGNMFNLLVNNALQINALDINLNVSGNVTIYYKSGIYQGFEATPGSWTQIYSGTITTAGANLPTLVTLTTPLSLVAGQYALYVNADLSYTNITVGTNYANADLTLTVGAGFCSPFSGPIAGRAWNGTIYYTKLVDYTYSWSNGASTQDVTGLAANTYTVTLTDYNNCTASNSFVVGEPLPFIPALDSFFNVSCHGLSDGGIYISMSGATPPYTYAWSNNTTNQDLTNVPAGIYYGTVTDANGCTFISPPVPVTEPDAIVVAVDSVTHISCNGAIDGAIDVSVSGGNAPYTFTWSNGSVTEDLAGLNAGGYIPTVTDDNGCTVATAAINVTEPAALVVVLDSVTDVTCNGGTNGEVFVTVTGGTTPYTFAWSNGATTQDVAAVAADDYTLTTTDANGCIANNVTGTVSEPTAIAAAVDSFHNVTCAGAANGAVYASATGGTGTLSFEWSNDSTTLSIANLAGGTYTLTATDDNGCTATISQVVNEPSPIIPALDSIVSVKCYGASTGAIYVSISGGTTPYSYLWSNGATTQDITGLPAGNYSGTVTDANGCVLVSPTLPVTQPGSAVTATSTVTDQVQGGAMGAVNVTVSGGNSPYTYNWSNGATTEDINSVPAGIYTCTITDANGCTLLLTDTVDLIIGIANIVAPYRVSLYPNPTQGKCVLEVSLTAADDVTIEVYTIEGQLLRRFVEENVSTTAIQIDLSDEAQGMYVAKVRVAGNTSTHRIVVTQ